MKLTYTQKLLVVKNCEQFGVTFTARGVYSSSDRAFQGKFLCQLIASSLMMILNTRIKEYEKSPLAFSL